MAEIDTSGSTVNQTALAICLISGDSLLVTPPWGGRHFSPLLPALVEENSRKTEKVIIFGKVLAFVFLEFGTEKSGNRETDSRRAIRFLRERGPRILTGRRILVTGARLSSRQMFDTNLGT